MLRRAGFAVLGAVLGAASMLVGSAEPAAAVQVSNEAELRAAFATDASIDVEADITLTDCTGGGDVGRLAGVTDPVTIDGHGHTIRQSCPQRVFFQGGSGLMTVRNLTITGGRAPGMGNGGGILAASPLKLENTTVVRNQAGGAGGGIGSDGPTTIIDSTFDSNISDNGIGGGISTGPNAHTLVLINSTVADNLGGGIATPADDPEASVTVVNSTITGNTIGGAGSLGGGIFSSAGTTLVYATVAGNTAGTFGNIDSVRLESFASVVADSEGTGNCLAATTSHGYNFSDDDLCGFTDPTDRENAGDPRLGPLSDNGGPTRTRLPDPGSPLIDFIPIGSCRADGAAGVTTDQRGVTRPQGPGCDIGAVEVVVDVPPTPPAPPAAPVTVTPRFTG